MNEFTLHITLGNDAMQSHEDIAEALRKVAAKIEAGNQDGLIRDENGNGVGDWAIA